MVRYVGMVGMVPYLQLHYVTLQPLLHPKKWKMKVDNWKLKVDNWKKKGNNWKTKGDNWKMKVGI